MTPPAAALPRWTGPALALAGAALIALVSLGPQGDVAVWLGASVQSFGLVLPLVGLGIALGHAGRGPALVGYLLFPVGAWAGLAFATPLFHAMEGLPGAMAHHFYTVPAGLGLGGLLLLAPGRLRVALLLPAAALIGAVLGLTIRLTDPSLNDPAVPRAGLIFGAWLLAATGLSAAAFRPAWTRIAAPILGSWLLTAGIMYGTFAVVRPAPPMALPAPAPAAATPGFDTLLPAGD